MSANDSEIKTLELMVELQNKFKILIQFGICHPYFPAERDAFSSLAPLRRIISMHLHPCVDLRMGLRLV